MSESYTIGIDRDGANPGDPAHLWAGGQYIGLLHGDWPERIVAALNNAARAEAADAKKAWEGLDRIEAFAGTIEQALPRIEAAIALAEHIATECAHFEDEMTCPVARTLATAYRRASEQSAPTEGE